MQIIDCYSICVWDGGSGQNHKYYVSNRETAQEWVKTYTFDSIYQKQFIILDSMDEIANFQKEELRKSALSKLSADERDALGL